MTPCCSSWNFGRCWREYYDGTHQAMHDSRRSTDVPQKNGRGASCLVQSTGCNPGTIVQGESAGNRYSAVAPGCACQGSKTCPTTAHITAKKGHVTRRRQVTA